MIKKFIKKIVSPIYRLELNEKKNIKDFLKTVLSDKKNQKWLDVGCGSKPFLKEFKNHSYVGIDIKRNGYGQAPKLADKFYNGVNIPYEDDIFDGVLCTQVLGVADEPEILISEIDRVLKKNSYFILSTPFMYKEVERPYDYRRYTSYGIEKILKDKNFEIINNIKCLSGLQTIAMILSVYLNNNCKYRSTKLFLLLLVMIPIQLLFSILEIFIPDNRDVFYASIVMARRVNS